MKGSMGHATSRKNFLRNGRIVKFYPEIYGYLIHEAFRILFQAFNGVYRIDFVSRKRRVMNEVTARRVLASLGIRSTKLAVFSPDEHFLEEVVEGGAENLCDVEKTDPVRASKAAKTIGVMTRAVNDSGHYFIDNRSSNWLVKNDGSIVRTDLELFRRGDSDRKFYAKCDCLSFVSSSRSSPVRENFAEGYGKRMSYSPLTEGLAGLYIRLSDILFG